MPFFYHELNTNNTKTIQNKNSNPFTILFHQTLHSYNNFVQVEVFLKVTNTHLYTTKKETSQEISYHMVPYVISHKII
jgi:hypothetical protein